MTFDSRPLKDNDFIAAVVENPSDRSIRLRYAEFLDRLDDHVAYLQAEFLRLMVQLAAETEGPPRWVHTEWTHRLLCIAGQLDPQWVASMRRDGKAKSIDLLIELDRERFLATVSMASIPAQKPC